MTNERTMATTSADKTVTATRNRKALYWLTTGVAAFMLAAIAGADLLRLPAVIDGLAHLGYPPYFATILGVWKLLGVAAIIAPGLPRVKEWAYAGMFFILTGAAISHSVSADPVGKILFPLVLLGVVTVSSALRPAREATVVASVRAPRV
jgi:uncharacterized membrane protein YphA (DoxX/SURF4 family)